MYNVRVADHHTYFVGNPETWGFSVWAHNACIVVYRYDQGKGHPVQLQHWSIQVTTDDEAVLNSDQWNFANGFPDKGSPLADYLKWHPKAWVRTWELPGSVPALATKVNAEILIRVTDAQAMAAKAEVRKQAAREPYTYDLRTASCFTYVVTILKAAGVPGLPSPAANNETMDAILEALKNLGNK